MFLPLTMASFLMLAHMATYITHPLMMALTLMLFAVNAALFSLKLLSSWFFYMLVLVFLGGVMVVIMFMVSICSNEQLMFNSSTKGNMLLISIPLVGTCALHPQMGDHSTNQIMLSLYQNDNSWGFVMLIAILIICMISAIGLSKIEGGPLVKRL